MPSLVMIKMFLDDSLHHTYNYVDQPYTYFCCYVTLGHYLIMGGDATFCNEVSFCLP